MASDRALGAPVPHPLPLREQDVGVQPQVFADRRPLVLPVDHRLEVPAEVSPADLAAVGGQVVVGRVPVGRQDPPSSPAINSAQHRPGADRRTRNTVTRRSPRPTASPACRPPATRSRPRSPASRRRGRGPLGDRFEGGRGLALEVAHGRRADRHPEQIPAEPATAACPPGTRRSGGHTAWTRGPYPPPPPAGRPAQVTRPQCGQASRCRRYVPLDQLAGHWRRLTTWSSS